MYLYCISVIPTSIDDQANHIKRKSNLIFGEAATTGLLKRKDERDISSDLRSEKQKDDRQKPGHVIKNIDTDFLSDNNPKKNFERKEMCDDTIIIPISLSIY